MNIFGHNMIVIVLQSRTVGGGVTKGEASVLFPENISSPTSPNASPLIKVPVSSSEAELSNGA